MNIKDVVRFELIGSMIGITESKNKSLLKLKGKIIDETKNTFTLETSNGIKKIIKSQVKFKMKFNNKIIEIDGRLLVVLEQLSQNNTAPSHEYERFIKSTKAYDNIRKQDIKISLPEVYDIFKKDFER